MKRDLFVFAGQSNMMGASVLPPKRAPKIKNSYEYKLVKWADRLSAYLKCVEETKLGNSEFKKAKTAIEKELKGIDSKEVAYFMEKFVPAYSLTLDELD